VSPILIRPVREQLEHDRLIRHLQAKYKRKHEVGANLGDEQGSPLKIGTSTHFPDLVLTDDRRVMGIVEVETGESVNKLEAMHQWANFTRSRAPFYLYVPVQAYDTARRLCDALGVKPAEIWTYRTALDSFDLVRMYHDPSITEPAPARTPSRKKAAARTATPAAKKKPAAKAARKAPKTAKKTTKKTAKKVAKKTVRKAAKKAAGARGKTAKAPARKAKAARPPRALAGKKR